MPLWMAVVLFLMTLIGIACSCLRLKKLPKGRSTRILPIVGFTLLAIVCAVYIGLTLLFVGAVSSQPPAP